MRPFILSVLCGAALAITGCRTPRTYTLEELGCGAGAYPGLPLVLSRAQWPEPPLSAAQHAAVHVTATDAANGRPAVPLNVWIIQGADTTKKLTSTHGTADVETLAAGDAQVVTWFFNFVSTIDTVTLRAGFKDSVRLRLGRHGNECYIVPDTRRSRGR